MKTAIIGSRSIQDYNYLENILKSLDFKITEIISGGAKGVDTLAEIYSFSNSIPITKILPEWNKYGRGAGLVRNMNIIKESDIVVALWDGKSKGTLDSINKARKLDKKVFIFKYGQ